MIFKWIDIKKIPSVIQIFIADMLAVMFLFPVVSKVYELVRKPVGYSSPPFGIGDYVFFALGALIFVWILATIFRPKVHATHFVPVFHGGGLYISNPQMAMDYPFSSTHPSYIFIDLLSCGLWWFARWAWSEGWTERVYQGTILLAMGLVIPAIRLFAWYVLRLRPIAAKDVTEDDLRTSVRRAWRPVAVLYCSLLLIAGVSAVVIVRSERRQARELEERKANLTVVDSSNWKDTETFSDLFEQSAQVDGHAVTRVIRLRGLQKSVDATTCTNDAGQGTFATALVTLGKSADVLVFSYIDPTALAERAAGNGGKTLEAIGRLMPLPKEIPTWKKYCGLEKLSPRPRWVLVEESP